MKPSVSASSLAALHNGVASVEKLQGYLGMLDAIVGVCRQADREGANGSQRRSGKAMLADCREHVGGLLKRLAYPPQTTWEMGLADLFEVLWETMHPMPHASEAELMGRVQKARRIAATLEKLLSAFMALESIYPADVEGALERFYGADGEIPF